ncbi:slit homolog 3 protein-like [Strongylocentrotus purpuratus]|uniref:Uncharacterized protein n=1 Tax=Strongylocentrotus purpuratus TaxID=7668 RepID=A0A7M7N666_STRPU|nr:slit homolog 3 protein-like [Strongylocentrotus purpuratus]
MMLHLLVLVVSLALFPPLNLSGQTSDNAFHSTENGSGCYFRFKYSCDDLLFEFDRREILREGSIQELSRCSASLPSLINSCKKFTVSGLQYIESGGFKGLENIQILVIENHFFDVVERGMLRYLDKLENLVIGSNHTKIAKLENEAFENLRNLNNLTLSNNDITDLQPSVFKGLENVTSLNLAHNKLQTLGPNSFSHMPSLEYLNLRKNKLRCVRRTAFYNLPHLKEIDLRDNMIKVMAEPSFDIHELHVAVDLTGNPLLCDCRMSWISSWLNESRNHIYGQCQERQEIKNHSLFDVYNNEDCLPFDIKNMTLQGRLLHELPCAGVDCTWITPDGRQLSEHGERQGPYFLTNNDALIIDTNTANSSIEGTYSFSYGDESDDLVVNFQDKVIDQVGLSFRNKMIIISLSCSVITVIILCIITRYVKMTRVKQRSGYVSEENKPLFHHSSESVFQSSYQSSGWQNISQETQPGGEKFRKSPSFENGIIENFNHSGCYNTYTENK